MSATQRELADIKAKQMRRCCNIWHIKSGIAALGLLELVVVTLILSGILAKISSKTRKVNCDQEFFSRILRNCDSVIDWALIVDYFIALLLFTIAICVLLLFLGVLLKSPSLLLPHLLIQGVFLISSFSYFVFYARSYFYVDLYEQKKSFDIMAFLERMWLATLLLVLAAFQLYIFFAVIKCCLYLQEFRNERMRRFGQFEECSKRVQNAKRDGLWRYTSWGGAFQQYVREENAKLRYSQYPIMYRRSPLSSAFFIAQYTYLKKAFMLVNEPLVITEQYAGEHDSDNHKKKRDKPTGHVQWNLQANIEFDEPTDISNSANPIKEINEEQEEQDGLSDFIRSIGADTNESRYHRVDNKCSVALSISSPNKK